MWKPSFSSKTLIHDYKSHFTTMTNQLKNKHDTQKPLDVHMIQHMEPKQEMEQRGSWKLDSDRQVLMYALIVVGIDYSYEVLHLYLAYLTYNTH